MIRYCFMLHQLKKQRSPQRQNRLLTAGRMLTLQRLLAKLAAILTSTSITSCTRQKPHTHLQHAGCWLHWLYKALQLLMLMM